MIKNYRCPGCSSTMEFLPSEQKLYCAYCGSLYSVAEWNALQEPAKERQKEETAQENAVDPWAGALGEMAAPQKAKKKDELLDDSWLYGGMGSNSENSGAGDGQYGSQGIMTGEEDAMRQKEIQRRHATIQMKILHCNACGAELAVNGVEASSFCAYCGQAAVVMDRVEDYLQPDYIMPFRITKEQAEGIIRSRLAQGAFIPEGIKNFEVEKLRGIYIPFWLFDIYYGDDQYWKYKVKRGKSTVTRYAHRLGDCFFHRMTLDASKNFNDDSSQRLEPFNMNDLREFDAAYLTGFYSDRFDVGTDDLTSLAYDRAKELFDENVRKTLHHQNAKLEYSIPLHRIKKKEYALLPVWFLTFRYENMPYTILVNGQTGKMVGAVPFVKKKAGILFGGLAAIFCILFGIIGAHLTPAVIQYSDDGRIIGFYVSAIGLAIYSTWSIAIKKYKAMITSIGLTRSSTTSKFVRERQDKS